MIEEPEEIVQGLHSTYIYEVVKLMIKYGLDINGFYENENVIYSVTWVDNEFLAADTMVLLLENGGDTNVWYEGKQYLSMLIMMCILALMSSIAGIRMSCGCVCGW